MCKDDLRRKKRVRDEERTCKDSDVATQISGAMRKYSEDIYIRERVRRRVSENRFAGESVDASRSWELFCVLRHSARSSRSLTI